MLEILKSPYTAITLDRLASNEGEEVMVVETPSVLVNEFLIRKDGRVILGIKLAEKKVLEAKGEAMKCIKCEKEVERGNGDFEFLKSGSWGSHFVLHTSCLAEYEKLKEPAPETFRDALNNWLDDRMARSKRIQVICNHPLGKCGIPIEEGKQEAYQEVIDWVFVNADLPDWKAEMFAEVEPRSMKMGVPSRPLAEFKAKLYREITLWKQASAILPCHDTFHAFERVLNLIDFGIPADPLAESKKQEGKRGCVEDVQDIPIILDSIEIAYCGPTGAKVLVNYHSPADPLAEFKAQLKAWLAANNITLNRPGFTVCVPKEMIERWIDEH